jgi:hypothetical protein
MSLKPKNHLTTNYGKPVSMEKQELIKEQRRFLTWMRFMVWRDITDEERIAVGITRNNGYIPNNSDTPRIKVLLNGLRSRYLSDFKKYQKTTKNAF